MWGGLGLGGGYRILCYVRDGFVFRKVWGGLQRWLFFTGLIILAGRVMAWFSGKIEVEFRAPPSWTGAALGLQGGLQC